MGDHHGLEAAQEQVMAKATTHLSEAVKAWNRHRVACDHTDAEMWGITINDLVEGLTSEGPEVLPHTAVVITASVSRLAALVREGVLSPDLYPEMSNTTALTLHAVAVGDEAVQHSAEAIREAQADPDITDDDLQGLAMTMAQSALDSWTRPAMAVALAAAIYRLGTVKGINA